MKSVIYSLSQIILFISLYVLSFFMVRYLVSAGFVNGIKNKINTFNNTKSEKLTKYISSSKKMKLKKNRSLFIRLDLLIEKSEISKNRGLWFLNSFSLTLICIFLMILSFIYFYNFFELISVAFFISIIVAILPILAICFIVSRNEANIEKIMSNFLIQLKNNTQIHNDIITAFKMVKPTTPKPLCGYIENMLTKINSGVRVEDALDDFADKINIEKFKLLIKNIKYCYIYGGSFTELLDKTQKFIFDIEQEKNKRTQETRAARYILIILIVIDFYMYFKFIWDKPQYLYILTKSFIGQVILNINFLSICFVLWLSYWVKKLDY